jgi:hypothetical protein
MKRIEVIQTFKHDSQTFHAGEIRVVTPEAAGYFCGLGWAKADGLTTGAADTSEKTLDVQKSYIGQSASTLGVK